MNKLILPLILLVSVFISCKKEDDTPKTASLTINLSGIKALGADYVYEGWIVVNRTPISTGRFCSVSFPQSFTVNKIDLTAATKFVLTIEPSRDPDPTPTDQKLIAGDFSGNTAIISTATAPGIGDFSTAAGQAFLRTPTDET